jgi:signal transduction histidine kinase
MALWGSGDELFIFDLVNDKIQRTAYGDEEDGIASIPMYDTESFWAAVHPDDRSQVREALISHIQGHSPYYEAVYRVGYPPDNYQWAVSKARIVEWSEDGQPEVLAGASKNITELKNTEAALRDLNESLETLVDQRTVNLKEANRDLETALTRLQETQKQLVESEKMASLGGLVAGIAHEINTPLGVALTAVSHQHAGIETNLKQLQEQEQASDDELNRWRNELQTNEIMTRNLERAVELINNFKLVAVDRSREVIRDFNLNEYLSAIVLSLKPQLNEGKHTIEVHCPESLILHSYPGALHQILGNLIMNSIHHGFVEKVAGEIRIDVSCSGDQVELRYRDDGVGLAAGIEGKIFDPFFTTNRSRGSSGLGMHIVFNLVTQALGGTIRATSEVGCCAEFVLNFPVKASEGSQHSEAG